MLIDRAAPGAGGHDLSVGQKSNIGDAFRSSSREPQGTVAIKRLVHRTVHIKTHKNGDGVGGENIPESSPGNDLAVRLYHDLTGKMVVAQAKSNLGNRNAAAP